MKTDSDREIIKELCQQLLEERQNQGISQQRLSELAGISRTGLRHIESQEINPTLYSLLKISSALDVNLASLLETLMKDRE